MNKYAEILLPFQPIERLTKFIVEKEAWYLVELDKSSVKGVMYLSLTEDKINIINDDVVNNVADTDKLAKYNMVFPEQIQSFKIGDEVSPLFHITKNGVPVEAETKLTSLNKKVVRFVNNKFIAVAEGEAEIEIKMIEEPYYAERFTVQVVKSEDTAFAAYIEGDDTICLNRQKKYSFLANKPIEGEVVFSIDSKLATIIKSENNECVVKTNATNKLGDFVLVAVYNGETYEKTIRVIPLW